LQRKNHAAVACKSVTIKLNRKLVVLYNCEVLFLLITTGKYKWVIQKIISFNFIVARLNDLPVWNL